MSTATRSARRAGAGYPRTSTRDARRSPLQLTVRVVDAAGRPVRPAPGLARWLQQAAPARIHGSVTIALVSDARMRTLNRSYRGADYATDVLSFPATDSARSRVSRGLSGPGAVVGVGLPGPGAVADLFLGDIAIATGVAARQARERGHSLRTELRVLALHGLLHVAGFDHERDSGEMAALERRLRRKGGLREGLIEREGER